MNAKYLLYVSLQCINLDNLQKTVKQKEMLEMTNNHHSVITVLFHIWGLWAERNLVASCLANSSETAQIDDD